MPEERGRLKQRSTGCCGGFPTQLLLILSELCSQLLLELCTTQGVQKLCTKGAQGVQQTLVVLFCC